MVLRQTCRRVLGNLVAISLFLPLSGCLVVSLQPFYDTQTPELSEAWLGTWDMKDEKNEKDETASLTIARGAWNAYEFTYVEGSESTRFAAHITRLGTRLVLDLTTAAGIETPVGMVQVHWPFLFEQQGDRLTVRALNYDWFKGQLNQKPLAGLAAVFDGEQNIVMTASTTAVREWLARNLASAVVWEEPTTFQRRAAVPGKTVVDSSTSRWRPGLP